MDRNEAVDYLSNVVGVDVKEFLDDNPEYSCLLRVRRENTFLPMYDMYGTQKTIAEWVLIDMTEKIDTGLYGAVYYVPNKEEEEVYDLANKIGINRLYEIVRRIRGE